MSKWTEVKAPDVGYPCFNCFSGWIDYHHKEEDGKHYVKKVHCHDKCQRLKEWKEKKHG